MNKSNFFAEIVESSLDSWTAQSWQWNKFPTFGSIIVTENNENKLFAIVSNIQTNSIDPTRQTFAYQKTEQELLQEQPQIFEFLKTTFTCLSMGYQKENKIYHILPAQPPKIHSFIREATIEEISQFFQSTEYLQTLFAHANKIFNFDELILALLNNLIQKKMISTKQFDEFIEIYSMLTGNDYRRLKLFIRRINSLNILQ